MDYIPLSHTTSSTAAQRKNRNLYFLLAVAISFTLTLAYRSNLSSFDLGRIGLAEYRTKFGWGSTTNGAENEGEEGGISLGVAPEEVEEDPLQIDWNTLEMAQPEESKGGSKSGQVEKVTTEPIAGKVGGKTTGLEIERTKGNEVKVAVGEDLVIGSSKPALPLCERTILYSLKSQHGFGSEFLMATRVATVAKYLNYIIILDSSQWNYGPLESYFLPIALNCIPPPKNIDRFSVGRSGPYPGKKPDWPDHLIWRRNFVWMDQFIQDLFVDESNLRNLHLQDGRQSLKQPLTAQETLPPVFTEVYLAMSDAMRELWQPNPEIASMIDGLVDRLAPKSENVEKEAEDLSIGVHVRLGDKYREASKSGKLGPNYKKPSKISSWFKIYLEAATTIVDTLLGKEDKDLIDSVAWVGAPVLVVMSDNAKIWQLIRDKSEAFLVIGTEPVEDSSESFIAEVGLEESRNQLRQAKDDPFAESNGFHEAAFNKLPLAQRIRLTKTFVRDVSALSMNTDGLVFSGSSNVGRLMLLLMPNQLVSEERAISVDTRWFPTSSFI